MNEVILDTETTGLSVKDDHRIVEIACVETKNLIPTKNVFYKLINPEREISKEALKIHGYSRERLDKEPKFKEIANDLIEFISGKKLIIHNAPFDLAFLNYELKLINHKGIDKKNVVDTLEMARAKFPGAQNSLDALCKRFNIDNSKREKHSALLDCHLLKEVYVNLLDQKEPKLNLETSGILEKRFSFASNRNKNLPGKVVKINDDELKLHKDYLKTQLSKNNYN